VSHILSLELLTILRYLDLVGWLIANIRIIDILIRHRINSLQVAFDRFFAHDCFTWERYDPETRFLKPLSLSPIVGWVER